MSSKSFRNSPGQPDLSCHFNLSSFLYFSTKIDNRLETADDFPSDLRDGRTSQREGNGLCRGCEAVKLCTRELRRSAERGSTAKNAARVTGKLFKGDEGGCLHS